MKSKKFVIVITLLICLSTIVIIPEDLKIEASGGSGSGGDDNGFLDFEYMWDQLREFCNVTHKAYNSTEIRKGRAFGTAGDEYTANHIWGEFNDFNLINVEKKPLQTLDSSPTDPIYIPGLPWKCNYKVETIDFKMEVINTTQTYPFQSTIPKNATFVMPSGLPKNTHWNPLQWTMDYNQTFTNAELVPKDFKKKWPLIGATTQHHLNVSGLEVLNIYSDIYGNTTYIQNGDPVPEVQEGRVFIFEEEDGCDDQLENVTNATGVILINNTDDRYATSYDFSNLNSSSVRIDDAETNLSAVIELLENNTYMMVENLLDNEILTFIHNFSFFDIWWPDDEFFVVGQYKPGEYGIFDKALWMWIANYFITILDLPYGLCKGFIFYYKYADFDDDIHEMESTKKQWRGGAPNAENQTIQYYSYFSPSLQFFSVNRSIGEWLYENASTTTVSGYFEQEDNDVDAFNVVGNLSIEESPNDAIVVLSSRFDGWWGETPGDSGAGTAIILGIAKYFTDYDIKPKYNLSFVFTTGEEYLMRGSWYHSLTHPQSEHNIIRWIGTDQLGFTQPEDPDHGFEYKATCKDEDERCIVENISMFSDFESNTGLNFTAKTANLDAKIASQDDVAWLPRSNCKTIAFSKDDPYIAWKRHHTAGIDYTEGDCLNYMNQNETNDAFNLTWDIIKYFTVNPDCWYDNPSWAVVDTDDADSLVDTISFSFDVISTLPHDNVMINTSISSITSSSLTPPVTYDTTNFTVNRNATSKTINITLPADESPGFYSLQSDLYNSTGWINEIVDLDQNNINQTEWSNSTFLYPYNYGEIILPNITNVSDSPDPVGYGFNVTISADVTSSVSSIDIVTVNITYPNSTTYSFNMTNTINNTYEYVFNDTWQYGQYDYVIWAKDVNGNESGSSQYSFDVSVDVTISVCTIKDSYEDDELVNLTDPPIPGGSSQEIGYELLDDNEVLRIWNKYDSYYFNTSNGIQFSNHYNEYWSHNVLMLGYYNNDVWNLIYRTDELSGFNKNIYSDDETYVNATIWKDLSYGGYDFRLAIRYYLGVDDNELTIIPYIKNIDTEDIPYNLGFAWEMNDIQIDMTTSGDYIEINGTSYYLNQTLDNTYKNMENPCFYIREDKSDTCSESLYLRWDESLNDIVKVKSRTGEYNAPVTLGIKIGTLGVGQEKYTSLFWHDASESVFYFNGYDTGEAWASNPSYMVDGSTSNYSSTGSIADVELCNNNTCNGSYLGVISKVELRCYGYWSGMMERDIRLRPVFSGGDGNNHYFMPPMDRGEWSLWFDITNDKTPSFWDWKDVKDLDCDVESGYSPMASTVYCSKVEMRVTYTPNFGPVVSNPVPTSGSNGVSIQPALGISVSDSDGDTMNITWLSNSSGSWQTFGTNLSVSDGTYYQNFTNASVNGQWWYWKVNVSDGINYTESDVYSFYTGYESKIKNSGSTNIKGYLLIQVQFYNNSSSTWEVALDTINETSPRTINASSQLGLDTIFNGLVNTSNLSGFGNGTYRIYAALHDPNDNILKGDDETELIATYEFTVTFD